MLLSTSRIRKSNGSDCSVNIVRTLSDQVKNRPVFCGNSLVKPFFRVCNYFFVR